MACDAARPTKIRRGEIKAAIWGVTACRDGGTNFVQTCNTAQSAARRELDLHALRRRDLLWLVWCGPSCLKFSHAFMGRGIREMAGSCMRGSSVLRHCGGSADGLLGGCLGPNSSLGLNSPHGTKGGARHGSECRAESAPAVTWRGRGA